MSDEITATESTEAPAAAVETEAPAEEPTSAPSLEDLQKEVEKWKSLSRKHEGTAKSNAEAAKRLAEIEDAQKSETQRLNDQLTAAQQRVAELEVSNTRTRAAREAGLDADMAEYLTAADYDTALEQAKKLAEKVTPKTPTPNLAQGVRTPAKKAEDPNDAMRRLLSGN